MDIFRDVKDVVEAVRNAKAREKKCALLIGAGCSVKAGIPLASGFVRIIQKEWPMAYQRAREKTYPHCMAELAVGERRDLIARHVDPAKINWAHQAIAQLIKTGHVDRVLTTNFDPLVLRACAMVGVFPAVYDFAASQYFKPAYLPETAVFYLHGQHTGFVVLHTEEEVQNLSSALAPLFEDARQGRLWLVVGYSGENDPVFDHLAKVDRFDEGLYWVGYKDSEPAPHVRDRLLGRDKFAYYVKGHDADDFFALLGQGLGSFPPGFVQKPFSHLREMLGAVTPYTLPGQDSAIDVCETPKTLIDRAIADLEEGPAGKTLLAEMYLAAGKFDEVVAMQSAHMPRGLAKAVAWAYTMRGNLLCEEAKTKSGAEAEALFAEAGEKCAAALAIKPGFHEALNNWGVALSAHAKTKSGAKADALFAQAGEKYAAALAIKPDMHETLSNWGNALSAQAKTKSGAEAEALFAQAGEKYAAALAIKPDCHEALNNWGNVLSDQAKTKSGAEADALFAQAGEKYAAALAIKSDKHEALNNWGNTLHEQAKTKSGANADALFAQAGEKYAAALAIKPDLHEALNNWGLALSAQAKTKSGAEADDLLLRAGEKLQAALAIKPDDHGALSNWGAALSEQAKTKSGAEADDLLVRAGEKLQAALAIKPDKHQALNNWGAVLYLQAKRKSGPEADDLLVQAGRKCEAALGIKPDHRDALNNWGAVLAEQAKRKSGAEAEALFSQAGEKYAAALGVKPDDDEALNNWGVCLIEWARAKGLERAADLLDSAREKSSAAEALVPGSGAYNLACISCLRGDEAGCRRWLEVSRTHGQWPSREHLLADADLENVRAVPWFQELAGGA